MYICAGGVGAGQCVQTEQDTNLRVLLLLAWSGSGSDGNVLIYADVNDAIKSYLCSVSPVPGSGIAKS